jgi:hypothetical protein
MMITEQRLNKSRDPQASMRSNSSMECRVQPAETVKSGEIKEGDPVTLILAYWGAVQPTPCFPNCPYRKAVGLWIL